MCRERRVISCNHWLADMQCEPRGGGLHIIIIIATLTTPDVDDDVGVGVLGEGLRDDSLAAAKGARDGSGAALHTGEEAVKDPLAS